MRQVIVCMLHAAGQPHFLHDLRPELHFGCANFLRDAFCLSREVQGLIATVPPP